MQQDAFLTALRTGAPYIRAHSGRTFVICLDGGVAQRPGFTQLIYDAALLSGLGVRVVLAHGARPAIEQRMAQRGLTPQLLNGIRVTDPATLECVKQAVGGMRMEIEALLSTGLASTPMAGARVRVTGGNLVTAKPIGVREGVDHGHTGEVRRIDVAAINAQLAQGQLVLLSPIGYSPTGEIFNVAAEAIACATAVALNADKLVLVHTGESLRHRLSGAPAELQPGQAERLANEHKALLDATTSRYLAAATGACRSGVPRAHLLGSTDDGVLLKELYTRDGAGTLIFSDNYDLTRSADIEDIGGILALIGPLEQAGVLVARSREQLEIEIDHFLVMIRDGAIIACAALLPHPGELVGELACVAVHGDYRGQGRAQALLERIERSARAQGMQKLFALTTHTPHWFIERGFHLSDLAALPIRKRHLYNFQRNSTVLLKPL